MGFPPNFIHSLDATHMLRTAERCLDAGLAFAAVHDCFWTHANSVQSALRIGRLQDVLVCLGECVTKEPLGAYLAKKKTGRTFCVPGGTWVEHVNETPGGDAILFVSSDEPVLKAMKLYTRHGKNESGETVLLESCNKF